MPQKYCFSTPLSLNIHIMQLQLTDLEGNISHKSMSCLNNILHFDLWDTFWGCCKYIIWVDELLWVLVHYAAPLSIFSPTIYDVKDLMMKRHILDMDARWVCADM